MFSLSSLFLPFLLDYGLLYLFDCFFITTPNIPPIVVPNVPKNKPAKVVLIISSIFITSCSYKFNNY